jgi:hypothetical protein
MFFPLFFFLLGGLLFFFFEGNLLNRFVYDLRCGFPSSLHPVGSAEVLSLASQFLSSGACAADGERISS